MRIFEGEVLRIILPNSPYYLKIILHCAFCILHF